MTEQEITQKASKKAHLWGIIAFVLALNIIKHVPNLFIGLIGALLLGFLIDRVVYNIFYNMYARKNNSIK